MLPRSYPSRTFDSNGVQIAYIDQGRTDAGGIDTATTANRAIAASPRPPVLLIHGFASNLQVNWVSTGWVDLVTKAGYRAIAFDHRGHGLSEKLYDPEQYSSPIMAEDARRLLDHLGIATAHLLGYSMGARVSAFLTINHPSRVASATFGGIGINLVRGLGQRSDGIAEALEAPSLDAVTSREGRMFRAFAEQTRGDLRALAACMRSGRAPIGAEAVATIKCPVLVVAGTDDDVAGSAAELGTLIAGARVLAPEGRDHMKTVGDRSFKMAAVEFWNSVP